MVFSLSVLGFKRPLNMIDRKLLSLRKEANFVLEKLDAKHLCRASERKDLEEIVTDNNDNNAVFFNFCIGDKEDVQKILGSKNADASLEIKYLESKNPGFTIFIANSRDKDLIYTFPRELCDGLLLLGDKDMQFPFDEFKCISCISTAGNFWKSIEILLQRCILVNIKDAARTIQMKLTLHRGKYKKGNIKRSAFVVVSFLKNTSYPMSTNCNTIYYDSLFNSTN